MKKYENAIKNWPEDERPREKLFKFGEHTLSDTELLAILLRTGSKGQSAVALARSIIQEFKIFRNMSHTDIRRWKKFKGLGQAKIAQIKAAIEIGRRFGKEKIKKKAKITCAKDIVKLLMPRMRDLKFEIFQVLFLDGQNQPINGILDIEQGSITQASPVIREIMHKALENFAAALICVHNHPSGNPKPSQEDKDFTRELILAGKLLQIKVLDHIIFGNDTHFSFADEGLMK